MITSTGSTALRSAILNADGGLAWSPGQQLVRELDERLGLGALIEQHLADSRRKNASLLLVRPAAAVRL